MELDRALRQQLNDARRTVTELEAAVRQHDAVIAGLRTDLARAQRSGDLDGVGIASKRLSGEERTHRATLDRLNEARKLATGLFDRFASVPDPADAFGFLETGQPIALLPVRLETHFRAGSEGSELLVRIYPDDVHVDVHEPELTEEEVTAGQAFWNATTDADNAPEEERPALRLAAWAGLAQQFGRERAAWIARVLTPSNSDGELVFPDPPRHREAWTRAPRARALPDRWVILGYRSGGRAFTVWGAPVSNPLQVGLSPDAEIPVPEDDEPAVDPAIRWMVDFAEAERVGMGVRIPLGAGPPQRVDLLLALGVAASYDPRESAQQLSDLLDAHHYTGGLGFVRQGTPTNNSGDARSGFNPPDPTFERGFAIERGDPAFEAGDGSNGDRTATALGFDASVFAHVEHAGLEEDRDARVMNTALWHSTWGYYLDQVMAPVFTRAQETAFRRHFVNHVRGRGPLPVLRVGNQPYGLLPVTSLDSLVANRGESTPFLRLLQQLRDTFWRPGIAGVPHVQPGGDPDQTLLGILGMEGVSLEIAARSVFGGHYFRNWWAWNGLFGFGQYFERKDTLGRQALTQLGLPWSPRALQFSYLPRAHELTGPRVQEGPLSETLPLSPNYLEWLRTATPQDVRDEVFEGGAPNALLYMLLRHTALAAYGTTALHLMAQFGQVESAVHAEPEMLHFSARQPTLTVSNALDRRIPDLTGEATLGEYLHERHTLDDPETIDYSEFWTALEDLEAMSTASLDRLLAETLDLCSHRLDAWITSFADQSLFAIRQEHRPSGVHLGGYGWVENLEPAPGRRSEGYVHAPSLQHATTAAVLRSGYLSHTGTDGASTLAIDLSSARVRLATSVLDAVRQGQPLGAVLGYRFERGLHEGRANRELDRYILPFRNLTPLVARKLEQTNEPVEAIAAHNVVDGLALHARSKAGTIPWGQNGLPVLGSPDEAAVSQVLQLLDDVIDAVSDSVTAESVFQAVRGNPTRASSALDAIARGEAPPPELEVVRTARSGIALTHRVLVPFSGSAAPSPDWPTDTRQVRARAEPHLDAWLGSLIGDPARIRCRVEYRDAETDVVLDTAELRLSQLALSPLDAVLIVKLEDVEGSELERRLAFQASNPLPPGVPATATIRIVFARDPNWGPEIVDFAAFAELARSLRDVIARAKALTPADVLPAGEDPGDTFDTVELKNRAGDAVAKYREIADDLRDSMASPDPAPTTLRETLIRAAYFGVEGAYPVSVRGGGDADLESLSAQALSVEREMRRRVDRADALETAFDRTEATAAEQRDHDLARFALLFGDTVLILPRFTPANPGELAQAFAASGAVQAGDPQQVRQWIARMSHVRPGTGAFTDALLYADALAGTDNTNLVVGQLPFQTNDRWIALRFDGVHALEANRLSLVAQVTAGVPSFNSMAGLVVDEWVETIPASSETTGLAVHFDQPDARAPNAILLAVPPDPTQPWDLPLVERIMLETFDLMKLRAVDTDALSRLGQFLPALFYAANVERHTVSTDFTRNRATTGGVVG